MIGFDEIYSWVKDLPIVDWHNHLDLETIAADRPLGSLYEVWVKPDPYKHRAMRICGVPECLITGGADKPGPTGVSPVGEAAKWDAWMRTLPQLVGNPIFTWARMELEALGLNPEPYLHGKGENVSLAAWTPSRLLAKFNVEWMSPCVGASSLGQRASRPLGAQPAPAAGGTPVAPRERATGVTGPTGVSPVGGVCVVPSLRMSAGELIPQATLERFDAAGCRVVDISVDDEELLDREFDSLSVVAAFAKAHGWTMLLHLGALRATSDRLRQVAGPAGGYAGMRAPVDPGKVARFLDRLERNGRDARCPGGDAQTGATGVSPVEGGLPRTILMTLNPEAHAQLAVLAGSFVEDGVPGKVQLGPAWWWCDHEEGMRDVLEKNAAYGVLSTFVGMTTDSRSLLSFVRHDSFRRIFSRWVAEKVAAGAFPDDAALLRPLAENVCSRNARALVAQRATGETPVAPE